MRFSRNMSDFWSDREFEAIKCKIENKAIYVPAKHRVIHKILRALNAFSEIENPDVINESIAERAKFVAKKFEELLQRRVERND